MEPSLESLNSCPACGHREAAPFLSCLDYTVSQERFAIVACQQCGLRYTNPRPTESAIGTYYKSEAYVSHTDTEAGLMHKVYQVVKRIALRGKRGLIDRVASGNRLLDFGAGTGDFAGAMLGAGYQVLAYEPDADARERMGRKYPSMQMLEGTEQLKPESLDTITLWHVLEHIHRLDNTLSQFHAALGSRGKLIVAVPNCRALDAAFYTEHWAAYDVPRHIYHFTSGDLVPMMERHGFRLLELRPMWFDAYYVSLLSESYRGKGRGTFVKVAGVLRALVIASASNLKAFWDARDCSSVTYIFEKG